MLVAVKQVYLFELLFTHTWIGFKGNLGKLSNKKNMYKWEEGYIYSLFCGQKRAQFFIQIKEKTGNINFHECVYEIYLTVLGKMSPYLRSMA